jgi:hypothetical protein
MREHQHLPAMVRFVSKHVAQHLHADRPRRSPAVSAEHLDASPATVERFSKHLYATGGAFGQSRAGLLRRAMRTVELWRHLEVRSSKPDPLATHIVHVREDRRNGANLALRFGSPCRGVKMFDDYLIHALIGGKRPNRGWAMLRVNFEGTRGHCFYSLIYLISELWTE